GTADAGEPGRDDLSRARNPADRDVARRTRSAAPRLLRGADHRADLRGEQPWQNLRLTSSNMSRAATAFWLFAAAATAARGTASSTSRECPRKTSARRCCP